MRRSLIVEICKWFKIIFFKPQSVEPCPPSRSQARRAGRNIECRSKPFIILSRLWRDSIFDIQCFQQMKIIPQKPQGVKYEAS